MRDCRLVWNVWVGDFNRAEIRPYNIFDHDGFLADCKAAARKYAKDRDAFLQEVHDSLLYYYWAKCEWEIVLQHWPEREGYPGRKVDVSGQVVVNWDRFADYVWEHAVDLRRREKKEAEDDG